MHENLTTYYQNKQSPIGLLNSHANKMPCNCQAKLRLDILCIIGAPNHAQTLISPSSTYTIQFVEFTYCHDRFLEQSITRKHTKYNPLINTIQNNGWNVGAHEHQKFRIGVPQCLIRSVQMIRVSSRDSVKCRMSGTLLSCL